MDPMANQVYIDSKLSNLIKINSICTWGEVVNSLRSYITMKNLFDPTKMKVVCRNDELESLFGISEFAILDIGNLLKKLVCPVPQHTQASAIKTTGSSPTPTFYMKRKSEDCIEEEIQVKKRKSNNHSDSVETSTTCIYKENTSHEVCSPMILQIPSSPKVQFDCESNSADSVETTFCKDSDDTSDARHSTITHTFVTLETYDVEFEPLSSSDDQSDDSLNSESELDLSLISELSSIVTFVANLESDLEEYLADLSSEDSSSDSALSAFDFDAEIGLLDNWQCSTCLSKNSPINRYCSKCFCIRNGWCNVEKKYGFEKKKRKKRKPRSKRKKQKSKERIQHAKPNEKPCTSNDSSISKNSAENLCLLCCATPVNSSIIHGNFAHSFSCYNCALKLKAREARCPICRRHIEKVVYNLV